MVAVSLKKKKATTLFYLNGFITIARWYHLLCFALIGIGVYIIILFLMKEFTKEDAKFFFDILNAKKMFTYIKEEIQNK